MVKSLRSRKRGGVNHSQDRIIGMIENKEKRLGVPMAKLKEIRLLRQLEQWLIEKRERA